MRFTKMHSLGNDFIVVNGFTEQVPDDLRNLAIRICDRHLGVGADGMVIMTPSFSDSVLAKCRIFNKDGSETRMGGNGLCCAALLAKESGLAESERFSFQLPGGLVALDVKDSSGIVSLNIGSPRLAPADIPAELTGNRVVGAKFPVGTRNFYVTLVSFGNPHCVIFVDDVDSLPVEKLGLKIENHTAFPEKSNVEFVQLLGGNKLKLRTWERGCGETMCCRSGAAAAVVAAFLNGYVQNEAEVLVRQGTLDVKWQEDKNVVTTGPAAFIASGDFNY